MSNNDIFKLIHTIELFTNETLIKWNKSFPYSLGISPILVLRELQRNGPKKQTELAALIGYTPGAMTNISNKLIKLGFAERKYNKEDRRIVYLGITEKGVEVLAEAQQKGLELRMKIFEPLDEEEIKQFLKIHEKLLNKMNESDF